MKSQYNSLTPEGIKLLIDKKTKSIERANFYEKLFQCPEGEFFVQDIKDRRKTITSLYKEIAIDSPNCQLMLGVLQSQEKFYNEFITNVQNVPVFKKLVQREIKELNEVVKQRNKRDVEGEHFVPTKALKRKE